MKYADILKQAIANSNLSLIEISQRLNDLGLKTDKGRLSKLQNGKIAPAGDKLNDALAEVLEIDPIELKAAAYREKISPEVLEKLADQEVI